METDIKTRDQMIEERAEHLKRAAELTDSIDLLGNQATVFSIETRRNLKNTNLDVVVFEDEKLTVEADESGKHGFISSDSLAHMRESYGREEGDKWWVREV